MPQWESYKGTPGVATHMRETVTGMAHDAVSLGGYCLDRDAARMPVAVADLNFGNVGSGAVLPRLAALADRLPALDRRRPGAD
jgi:hypothetical protein